MAHYYLESALLAVVRRQGALAEERFKAAVGLSKEVAEREADEKGNLIVYLEEYANWLRQQGRNREAEACAAQAEKVRAKYPKIAQ